MMKVSSRFRYGLRLLVDLAISYEKGPVLLKNIADCEKISKKYLEQIVITLRTAGLIGATRGSKGGYFLTKDPRKIKITDIYKILEGPFAPVETRKLWAKLAECIEETFAGQTLIDITQK
jgi:Rrf2 family protein